MNLGTLTIEMAANVARLQQDLQAARGSVDSTFASIGSSVAKLKALVGTVFAGIAVGELLGAVEKVKTAAVDIERIAAASGASLDEFQRAAAGAKTVGVNLEKFGDIMKDTQDKLGDFLLTGGGELKDFFETIGPKVGVTAESFRNLSGPQALQLFYTSLEKANVGQEVMIQQMESIANDASMLAPLLANGGAEFKSLGEEAAKAGALMSSDLIYASKALGEEMMRMDTVTTGISNALMSELIPAITEMAAASREELSAGFEAVSEWVQDNKEQLVGAWEIAKQLAAEVWSIVKVAAELAVGIAAWAVESGFLEASLITVGLLIAGAKDGVDIIGAAFAKLGSIILTAVAKPMSGFLNDVGVVLKWAGQGDLAGVFLDAAEGIKTAGEAGAQYAAGVADKFAAGDTAVARFTANLGTSSKAAVTAAKSTYTAYQALGNGAGVIAKTAEDAKKAADKAAAAAQKLAEEGVKLAASLLAQDSGLSGDFAEKWNKLNAAYRAGAVSISVLTKAQSRLLADQPAMKAAVEERKKQLDDEAAAWTDVRKAMAAYGQAQEQAAQGVADGNKSLREEIELIGLSSKERTAVLQQRNREIILIKQATLAEMERQAAITGTMTREQIALAAEIEGLQERNELLGAQEARESWAGFWESINSTAYGAFKDVTEQGVGAFRRIGKTLKSAVLDALYQMTAKQWVIGISASGAGGAATAAAGGGGGLLSGLSTIGSLSSGVGLLGAGGLGLQAGFGALMSSGFAGIGASVTGGLAAIASGTGAGIAAGLGTIAGALGPIGLGLGAVYSIVKKFDTSGTYHSGGAGSYSAAGGASTGAAVLGQGLTFGVRAKDYSAQAEQSAVAISQAIVGMLDATASAFGKQAGYYAATAFADDSSKDGAWGSLAIKLGDKVLMDWKDSQASKWAPKEFADGDKGKEQYAAALALSVRDVLQATLSGVDWAQDIVGKLGDAPTLDALQNAVAYINQVNDAFVQMGKTLDGFAGMSDAAFAALMKASGGIEALASNAASYYENFYSESERMGKATASLTEELAKSGVSMPASKEAYRALVEEQLAAGESGAELAAKLLLLNGSFAQVTDYAEQAAKDAEQAAKDTITSLLDAVGIGAADMGKTFRDVLLGRTDAAEAGAALADSVTGGIYNAIAGGAAQQLTDLMMTSLITPVVQAAVAGTAISEAVSQSAIDSMVQQAQRAAAALGQIFSDPAFQAAIASVGAAITGVVSAAGAGIKPYSPGAAAPGTPAAGWTASEIIPDTEPVKAAWEDLVSNLVQQTKNATTELARLGMTGYEAALASIADKAQEQVRSLMDAGYMQAERFAREEARGVVSSIQKQLDAMAGRDVAPGNEANIASISESLTNQLKHYTAQFDRLSAAIATIPPEVQAMVDAETALLNARNKMAADATVAGLATEIERLGLTPLQREFAGITDRADSYIASLKDLGQATESNIAAVDGWAAAMAASVVATNTATAKATIEGLGKEVAQLGFTPLQRELAGITDRADGYVKALIEIGQATDTNVSAVNAWAVAMSASVVAADAARIAQAQRGQSITLLELLGDAEGALALRREDELAALDPLLRATQTHIYAVQDMAAVYNKTAGEIASLESSLANLTGTAAKTVQDVLGELMGRVQASSAFRASLGSTIEQARLSTMDDAGKAGYLGKKEAGLWAQLDGATDPAKVAAELQQTILDRINIEARLREELDAGSLDSLRQQLDVLQSMKQAVDSMQSAVDGLRLGGDSALNPYTQLQYAAEKFDAAFSKAQGGDMDAWKNVQSYGQSYVGLGRDVYASSTDAADIFFKVTEAMDQLVGMGMGGDPQIAALNTQIEALQGVKDNSDQTVFIGTQQVERLTMLDNRMAAVQEKQQAAADKQLVLAQQQIAELKENNALLKAQMEQQAAMAGQQKGQLDTANGHLGKLSDSARMAEAAA